jgi:hypothetical protein
MHKLSIASLITALCLFANGLPFSNTANASEVTSPFFAVDHGNANPVSINECTLQNHETYTGYALPIGAFTATDEEIVQFVSCSPPSSPGSAIEVTGSFKLLTTDGDEIDGEYVTTGTLDPVNGVSVQGGFRFISGTGRFTHVRGSGVVVAHGAPSPPFDFVGTFTGIISYGEGPGS